MNRYSFFAVFFILLLLAGCVSTNGKRVSAPNSFEENVVSDIAVKETPLDSNKQTLKTMNKRTSFFENTPTPVLVVKRHITKISNTGEVSKKIEYKAKSKPEKTAVNTVALTPEKKGSLLWLWIVLFFMFITAAGAYYYFLILKKTEQGTLTSLFDINKNDRVVYYEDNKEIGTWYYHQDGTISKHGKKLSGVVKSTILGAFKTKHAGDVIYKRNRIKDGVYKWYDKKTKHLVEEYTYKRDKKNGSFFTYYSNGRVKTEGSYLNNNLNGVVREYFEKGGVKATWIYEKKHLQEVHQFYENSTQVREEWKYDRDSLAGIAKEYYVSGEIKAEIPYKRNYIHGVVSEYYISGKIKEIVKYDMGKEIESKVYDESGREIKY